MDTKRRKDLPLVKAALLVIESCKLPHQVVTAFNYCKLVINKEVPLPDKATDSSYLDAKAKRDFLHEFFECMCSIKMTELFNGERN